MTDYVVLNGHITPVEDANISSFDAGLLHGARLFETLRVLNGTALNLADHLQRLSESGQCLGLDIQLDPVIVNGWIADLLELHNIRDARVRITVTRGDTRENTDPQLTTMLTAIPFEPYPAALYENGMAVIISQYAQNPLGPLTGHKTTSYMDRLLALREAREVHAGEALWFTNADKMLAEACVSNIFIGFADGTFATPPSRFPIPVAPSVDGNTGSFAPRLALPGITRKHVLRLCAENGISATEKMMTIHDVLSAKEIFLTNAIMGVMPVTHIEGHTVADGRPGVLTQRLANLYNAFIQEQSHGPAR